LLKLQRAHLYEVRPRRDKRGFDLISEALPFGGLWYTQASDAIDSSKVYSRSHHAVIRGYDERCSVIETHEHAGISKSGSAERNPKPPRDET
jgi:hypothetical protein